MQEFNYIILSEVVKGTSTNADGFGLFVVLDNYFKGDKHVKISLLDASPFSSSFLNSSFGQLIDKYGIEKVKSRISFTKYTKNQKRRIIDYFNEIETIA